MSAMSSYHEAMDATDSRSEDDAKTLLLGVVHICTPLDSDVYRKVSHQLHAVWEQLPDKDVAIRAACTSRQTQKKLRSFLYNAPMSSTAPWTGAPAATRSPALSTVANGPGRSAAPCMIGVRLPMSDWVEPGRKASILQRCCPVSSFQCWRLTSSAAAPAQWEGHAAQPSVHEAMAHHPS